MHKPLSRWGLLLVLAAAPAWAGFGDALPANTCPSGNNFKTKLAVLDVTGDGGVSCTNNAETAITCNVKKADSTGTTADFDVEFFDETTGFSITPAGGVATCGVPVGSTVTFITAPGASMPAHWASGIYINAPGGSCGADCFLHGSARVLSTGKVQCTGTRIDLSNHCLLIFPKLPLATKDLTVIKIPRQKGD